MPLSPGLYPEHMLISCCFSTMIKTSLFANAELFKTQTSANASDELNMHIGVGWDMVENLRCYHWLQHHGTMVPENVAAKAHPQCWGSSRHFAFSSDFLSWACCGLFPRKVKAGWFPGANYFLLSPRCAEEQSTQTEVYFSRRRKPIETRRTL